MKKKIIYKIVLNKKFVYSFKKNKNYSYIKLFNLKKKSKNKLYFKLFILILILIIIIIFYKNKNKSISLINQLEEVMNKEKILENKESDNKSICYRLDPINIFKLRL